MDGWVKDEANTRGMSDDDDNDGNNTVHGLPSGTYITKAKWVTLRWQWKSAGSTCHAIRSSTAWNYLLILITCLHCILPLSQLIHCPLWTHPSTKTPIRIPESSLTRHPPQFHAKSLFIPFSLFLTIDLSIMITMTNEPKAMNPIQGKQVKIDKFEPWDWLLKSASHCYGLMELQPKNTRWASVCDLNGGRQTKGSSSSMKDSSCTVHYLGDISYIYSRIKGSRTIAECLLSIQCTSSFCSWGKKPKHSASIKHGFLGKSVLRDQSDHTGASTQLSDQDTRGSYIGTRSFLALERISCRDERTPREEQNRRHLPPLAGWLLSVPAHYSVKGKR